MPFPKIHVDFLRPYAEKEGLKRLEPLYPFMVDLVNGYATFLKDVPTLELALKDTMGTISRERYHKTSDIREALTECFNTFNFVTGSTPPDVRNVPDPVLNIPIAPVPPGIYDLEAGRLRARRSARTTSNGRELVRAAKAMKGWFQWVSSGPVPGKVPEIYKKSIVPSQRFAPKESWSASMTEGGQWEAHEKKQNDFARWMNGGPVPKRDAKMSCWEAIFCAAYAVRLVTLDELRDWHDAATKSAADSNDGSKYYDILNNRLGVEWAEHVESVAGLIPQAGDIIYFKQTGFNDHVCLSLGRTWSAGQPEDQTFSLWHHNDGTFDLITLEELARHAGKDIWFAPCPFG